MYSKGSYHIVKPDWMARGFTFTYAPETLFYSHDVVQTFNSDAR